MQGEVKGNQGHAQQPQCSQPHLDSNMEHPTSQAQQQDRYAGFPSLGSVKCCMTGSLVVAVLNYPCLFKPSATVQSAAAHHRLPASSHVQAHVFLAANVLKRMLQTPQLALLLDHSLSVHLLW